MGYIWNGVPILLLTTTGRKSGQPRTTPLIHARDGDDYLVVASMGGAPQHPQWYLNLVANASAQIQDRSEHIDVTARTAGEDEKARLWKIVDGAVAQLRRVPVPHRPGDPRRRAVTVGLSAGHG